MVNWFLLPRQFSGEIIVFSTNGVGTTRYPLVKIEVGSLPNSKYKINAKWINDLNARGKPLGLLQRKHKH